jgi:integrase
VDHAAGGRVGWGEEQRKIFRARECPQGFFEQDELETIVSFLPPYLKDVVRFAYHTGWRKSEILALAWRDVHGDVIRLRPEIAKNKDGRMIMLVGELANIIDRRGENG